MKFPDSPRVIFGKNPLNEVVCQLRFPTILQIDEQRSAFQEMLRPLYPLYDESLPRIELSGVPPELEKLIHMNVSFGGNPPKNYNFKSADGIWTVALNRDFLALTTKKYSTWGEFKGKLQPAIDALLNQYKPTFFTRIGLRYQDVLKRSVLGLGKEPWSALIKGPFVGELSDADMFDGVVGAARQVVFALPNNAGQVQLQSGLATDTRDSEECFILDFDFFAIENIGVQDGTKRLDYFNHLSGSLFRHCITPALSKALDPQPA